VNPPLPVYPNPLPRTRVDEDPFGFGLSRNDLAPLPPISAIPAANNNNNNNWAQGSAGVSRGRPVPGITYVPPEQQSRLPMIVRGNTDRKGYATNSMRATRYMPPAYGFERNQQLPTINLQNENYNQPAYGFERNQQLPATNWQNENYNQQAQNIGLGQQQNIASIWPQSNVQR
jgi:hypothetical protein